MLRSRTDPLPSLAEAGVPGYSLAFLQAVGRGLRVVEAERPKTADEWLVLTAESPAKPPRANKRATADGRRHRQGRASDEDLAYARALGLIDDGQPPRIANPIYQEFVPREVGDMM